MDMKKILIIEDDENIRNELKELLSNANYEVVLLEKYQNMLEDILPSSSRFNFT